jgi:AcrR family transcriptional regulator
MPGPALAIYPGQVRTHPSGEPLSPNQRHKQRQIVEAARTVLARDGLAGCTVRAVAEASPLTKSAVHYYFSDFDELIDQAMTGHIQAFIDLIREAVDRHGEPADRFWAGVRAYLDIFDQMPHAMLLWFEYWIESIRKGRLEPVQRMHTDHIALFTDLLAAIPVDNAATRADALFTHLLGLIVHRTVNPQSFDDVRRQLTVFLTDTTARQLN